MKCPNCGSTELKVNEKRDLPAESAVRRRRQCDACSYRFTTYERIEIPLLMVIKKDGEREPYLKEKMASGIRKALKKRPFDEADIEEIVESLDREINQRPEGEIKSTEIGEMVVGKLKEIDEVAYLRFLSVYKAFESAQHFKKELEELER